MTENIYNYKITTDVGMNVTYISPQQDMSVTNGYSVYAQWTGSPVGTIELQASLDGVNFVTIAGSPTPVNGPGEALWEVTTAFYDRVRIKYIPSGGSGTLNVQINGKGDKD